MGWSARRWGHGVIAMSFVFLGAVLPARSAPALDVRGQVGMGGWIVPGRFVPLRVQVGADREVRGTLEVAVPGPGGDTVTHTHAVHVTPGSAQQITFDIIVTDPRRDLLLRVRGNGGEEARAAVPVGVFRVAEGIVAAVTREPAGLEFLAASGRKRRPAYLTGASLPSGWQGYDAVDLVVVRDLDPRALLPVQQEALVGWVAQGGRLLVAAHDALPVPPWLQVLLPARIASPPSSVPGVPVALAALVPDPGAEVVRRGDRPLAVRGGFGRGVVEVWAFDPFSPQGRAWPGRLPLWRSLLELPRPTPAASGTLADELPRTRPLPGSTQLVLALLSVAYIAAIRILLRRFGPARGGWVLLFAAVAAFGVVLFGVSAGARRAAGSIAQVSIIEVIPGAQRARAGTFVSLITPYGGRVDFTVPRGAAVRPLGPGNLRIDESESVVTGTARTGQGVLEVTQIVPVDLRAEAVERDGTLALVVTGRDPRPPRALLYRRRQIHRLGEELHPRTVLDPARWEPVDRPGTLGTDLAARAAEWLFKQLQAAGGEAWLVGRSSDERVGVRLPDGRSGISAQLVVIPVRLR